MLREDNRVFIRVTAELKQQLKEYAARHNTNISALSVAYYKHLLAEEAKAALVPEVEQI